MSLKLTMTEGFDLHTPDEWLPGSLVSIEEFPGQYDAPALKWVFQLDEDEREEWQFSSQKLSPKAKLYKWLAGLDPDNLPEAGEVVDFEKYVGTRVEVMFEQEKVDGLLVERVTRVRAEKKQAPIKGQQTRAAKAKVPDYGPDEAPF